ncbi:MAG: hypothetical protein CMJ32_08645 [Phycisphaerae bacterium]|nr:hypothetical protein [Phycisphaerae bacterium]
MAMLLVMICMATATILASAYLASRENSPAIAENVQNTAAARWSSLSGLEMTVAMLETEFDWRTHAANDGMLLSDHPMGSANLDVRVIDAGTGMPPNQQTRFVLIEATARVNGVSQVATATAEIPLPGEDESVDVDLSEFALLASREVRLEGMSTVAPWSTPGTPSPSGSGVQLGHDDGGQSQRIMIGVQSGDPGRIRFLGNAKAINSALLKVSGNHDKVTLELRPGEIADILNIPDQFPMPLPPPASSRTDHSDQDSKPGKWRGGFGGLIMAAPKTIKDDSVLQALQVKPYKTTTIKGPATVHVDDDLKVRYKGRLKISGQVQLVVHGDLLLQGGSIELLDDAELDLYIGGRVDLVNGYIGDMKPFWRMPRIDGTEPYMNQAERLRIYDIESGDPEASTWRLRGNTVVKGSIYAPRTSFISRDNAAIYGRIAADEIHMRGKSSIFYDPAMSTGLGFTDADSPAWSDDGTLSPAFKQLSDLGPVQLVQLSNVVKLSINCLGKILEFKPVMVRGPLIQLPGNKTPGPSPRTTPVNYDLVSIGTALEQWEGSDEVTLIDAEKMP